MDYQPIPQYEDKHSAGFARPSLVLGIISIATFCCIYTAMPCGALAIIFASLSRGGTKTFSGNAKIGLILGIIALSLCAIIYLFAFLYIIFTPGGMEGFLAEYENQMQIYESLGIR